MYFYFRSKEEVLYQIATSALDFTIEVAATEAKGTWIAGRAPDEPSPSPHHLAHLQQPGRPCCPVPDQRTHRCPPADIAAKQREVSQIVRQVITDGVKSGDFDVPDAGAATIAVLSLCLDVARWYRPGYRLTPQQLGDFNAVAALRIAGGHPAA